MGMAHAHHAIVHARGGVGTHVNSSHAWWPKSRPMIQEVILMLLLISASSSSTTTCARKHEIRNGSRLTTTFALTLSLIYIALTSGTTTSGRWCRNWVTVWTQNRLTIRAKLWWGRFTGLLLLGPLGNIEAKFSQPLRYHDARDRKVLRNVLYLLDKKIIRYKQADSANGTYLSQWILLLVRLQLFI